MVIGDESEKEMENKESRKGEDSVTQTKKGS